LKSVMYLTAVWLVVTSPLAAQTKLPKPLVTGLYRPYDVAVGADGHTYVNVPGAPNNEGGGAILKVTKGTAVPFAAGLSAPRGMAAWQKWLFVADGTRIMRVDPKGKVGVFVPAEAFPADAFGPAGYLADLVVDVPGNLYVVDSTGRAVYRINPKGKVARIADLSKTAASKASGLTLDSESHLLTLDASSGDLLRIRIADGKVTKAGKAAGDSLTFDRYGRLYVGERKGRVHVIPRPGATPVLLASGFQSVSGICLDAAGKSILAVDQQAGTLTALPAQVPGQEIDETPLALESVVAFPDLQWTGWKGETAAGLPNPLRPLVLTHAGDGSNRVFVATQQGVIHVFPNDPKATKTKILLDIEPKVLYQDKENETGLLGLAFPPDHNKSGQFYVFYTLKNEKLANVLARFRVSKDDPDKADPASEEILLKIVRPFWNHDGGTLCFGPDGYLYVALGDGGAANDPFGNGQNLKTLLGGVLRLDVSRKENGLPYAIPRDNPFVGRKDARPEKWAYGLRNVWRMSFDRKTGKLWAADVGQNLYEEINILKAGGNYGWNLREGLHPFGYNGVGPRSDLIDPIWEYNHDVGKSITGGHVYRGQRLPELDGAYLYADYITNLIRALRYDEPSGRVVANQPIPDRKLPVLSFGEDEQGEVYYMTYTPSGRGIYWFVRKR
jgi:glucose/arabinose dehydrogenase